MGCSLSHRKETEGRVFCEFQSQCVVEPKFELRSSDSKSSLPFLSTSSSKTFSFVKSGPSSAVSLAFTAPEPSCHSRLCRCSWFSSYKHCSCLGAQLYFSLRALSPSASPSLPLSLLVFRSLGALRDIHMGTACVLNQGFLQCVSSTLPSIVPWNKILILRTKGMDTVNVRIFLNKALLY